MENRFNNDGNAVGCGAESARFSTARLVGEYVARLSLITQTKMELLNQGVHFSPANLFTRFYEIEKYKTKSIKTAPTVVDGAVYDLSTEKNIIPSEVMLSENGRRSIVKLRYDEKSKLELSLNDGKIDLLSDETKIGLDVDLVPRVDLLKSKTSIVKNSDFTEVGDYVDIVGADRLSVLFFDGCSNWNCGEACKFCDLHPKKASEDVIRPTTNHLKQFNGDVKKWWESDKTDYYAGIKHSLLEIDKKLDLDHKHLYFMAGNLPTNGDVWHIASDLLEDVSSYLEISKYDSCLNVAPHDTIANLQRIKNLGIKQVQYNLEVANKQLFEEMCPGKIDYRTFVGKLIEAVDVFGKGNVRSSFVFGLQNKDEMLAEIKELARYGVVADYSVFQPKPFTPLWNLKPPSPEDVLDFTKRLADMYIEHGFRPIFCSMSSRSSIINEVFDDKNQ